MPAVVTTAKARCLCGIEHRITGLTASDHGRQVTCESCGRRYTLVMQLVVHIMAEDGTILAEPRTRTP